MKYAYLPSAFGAAYDKIEYVSGWKSWAIQAGYSVHASGNGFQVYDDEMDAIPGLHRRRTSAWLAAYEHGISKGLIPRFQCGGM